METLTITPKHETRNGSYCLFVKLDETRGVKFYRDAAERDAAMQLQEFAHSVGCGPAVYGKAEIDFLDGWAVPFAWIERPSRVYGYVTELINPCELTDEEYYALVRRLDAHKIPCQDTHQNHNVGKTFAGVTVKYDYDPCMNTPR